MYEQLKALKEGKTVAKPIYNHVNGYAHSFSHTQCCSRKRRSFLHKDGIQACDQLEVWMAEQSGV